MIAVPSSPPIALTDDERARYEWQMWSESLGEAGQTRLRNATVLVSRIGGVGGTVAYYLAAAGIGRLILAHAGNVKPSDLNRQLLMTTDALGTSRVESAVHRIRDLNPNVEVLPVAENLSDENASDLVAQSDVCVGAAPLFEERYALNAAAVRHGKPLVDCAMFDFEGQVTTILPGRTPCLACLCPEKPAGWTREFPVLGAVSGVVATIGAVEVVKVLCEVGEPLASRLLLCDLLGSRFREVRTARRADCPVCSDV